jgi:hypothetical protein
VALLTLDPRSPASPARPGGAIAPRPASLSGQALGIICNGLGNSAIMFDYLGALLEERYKLAGFLKVVKRGCPALS